MLDGAARTALCHDAIAAKNQRVLDNTPIVFSKINRQTKGAAPIKPEIQPKQAGARPWFSFQALRRSLARLASIFEKTDSGKNTNKSPDNAAPAHTCAQPPSKPTTWDQPPTCLPHRIGPRAKIILNLCQHTITASIRSRRRGITSSLLGD